jgi:hypothetical protein
LVDARGASAEIGSLREGNERMPLLELDGRTAWNNVFSNNGYPRWPRESSPRMMPMAVPQIEPSFRIEPGAKIFTVGSCFARNIEQHLALHHFDVPSHRYFGGSHVINKYNPYAILQEFHGAIFPNERLPLEIRLKMAIGLTFIYILAIRSRKRRLFIKAWCARIYLWRSKTVHISLSPWD